MRFTKIVLLLSLIAMISCSKKSHTAPEEPKPKPWDGRYSVTGTLTDFAEPLITATGAEEYSLIPTAGGNNEVVCKKLGFNGHLIMHGMNFSYYGTFGLIITIDPVTYKITGLTNSYGQPSANKRSAILDPSGVNAFDPVTKNMKIKYWMDETGIAGHRTAFDETWTYIGAR